MRVPVLNTVVSDFSLPDLQDRQVSLWTYKHQQPVVLVFCDEDIDALLLDFADCYATYREGGAEILVITPSRPRTAHLPFPVLIDATGQVTARLVNRMPTILVLDSYNELYARLEGPWAEGLNHRDILELIAQVEMACPECGVPWWPER